MNFPGADLAIESSGPAVRGLHVALARFGLAVPDAELQQQFFGPGTRQALMEFQNRRGLPVTGVVDADTARGLDLLLDDTVCIVDGAVTSPDNAGLEGLLVEVLDRNVGDNVLLTQATTDARGRFDARFPPSAFRERGKDQPDLVARVVVGGQQLALSNVHYNAGSRETLNIRLPARAPLQSEYETLTTTLSRNVNLRLGDLVESEKRQDITYLAHKTGWDARAVAMAALADQFSREAATDTANSPLPASFYYALFRAGLPANPETLYRTDAASVEQIWKQAVDQRVLPESSLDAVPQALLAYKEIASRRALGARAIAGASSLADLLAVATLDPERQQRFAELYTEHRGSPEQFWNAVSESFGQDMAARLQLDGKLAYLTVNNAPLMRLVHRAAGGKVKDPVELAGMGLYRAETWANLLQPEVPIPASIPGSELVERAANYAQYLAAHVRVSYPTASIADQIRAGDLAVDIPDQVHAFLTEHVGAFEIGVLPVQQYLAQNQVHLAAEVVSQVSRIQRVYQITPSDHAMSVLLRNGLDSAAAVARCDRDAFIATHAADLGGEEIAARIHERSLEVHNTVLNVTVSYLTARNSIAIGAPPTATGPAIGLFAGAALPGSSGASIIQPAAAPPANTGDVIAYPTLESLFGEMDFCNCDHCRSVLSPAAYLVDLLYALDSPPTLAGTQNPQTVLLARRPDIQHLPLTCENTNTPLPYIDVVNETLEYFIANSVESLSLNGYTGHDTGAAASADLLASPQYVMDAAYATLRAASSPPPLPFHRPLESARRYFRKFEVPLPLAMERLRMSESLERGTQPYGWRDILIEEIGISRPEYDILTDSTAVPLWRLVGFPSGTSDADVIGGVPNHPGIVNAKQFTRCVGITYADLVDLLRTRFVNPDSDLVPKLQRLGVSFKALQDLKDGVLSAAQFMALLPTGVAAPDPAQYGDNIVAWVTNPANVTRIMSLVTLVDPTGSGAPCQFDTLELRRALPLAAVNDTSTQLSSPVYIRLVRFIRLWKKLGWTLEQLDAALCALFRADQHSLQDSDIDTAAALDSGFRLALPRLGILTRAMRALNLSPKRDLLPLLACWSDITTHGEHSLYRQMFLSAQLLAHDAVFADNGYGEFLVDDPAVPKLLQDHSEAVRSALSLTGDEYGQIVAALGFDATTLLTVANLSAIFRHGYLARRLRLSVRELLLLLRFTGIDPFGLADVTQSGLMRLVGIVQTMKKRSLKPEVALYVLWNQDLSGRTAPDAGRVPELVRGLRADFVAIDDQFAATDDPDGNVARARTTLVFGEEAATEFFALLDDSVALDVPYTHSTVALEAAIVSTDAQLTYDGLRHRLRRIGLLTLAGRDALQGLPGVPAAFPNAVAALFNQGELIRGAFFTRHPELQPLYASYVASAAPLAKKRAALLAAFRPELARRRKRQQALQSVAAATGLELAFARTLVDPEATPYPLHAGDDATRPAMDDLLAVDESGLAAEFFFGDTIAAPAGPSTPVVDHLEYSVTGQTLPTNPGPGDHISAIWSGLVETPEGGFYNIVIESDATASISLRLDDAAVALVRNGNAWRNSGPLELKAGALHPFRLVVENVQSNLSVQWESPKRAREVIPARYLYPQAVLSPFRTVFMRLLKAASLMRALRVTASELAHLATDTRYQVAGDGWLNALPVDAAPAPAIASALLAPLEALLAFSELKAALSPEDERLLAVIASPTASLSGADRLLESVTRWDTVAVNDLLTHFSKTPADLADIGVLRRLNAAFETTQVMGIQPTALIAATTNDPDATTVRSIETALRARYAAEDWRPVVQPINDELRGLQRDALVTYVLNEMRASPTSAHIDTPDKLFEYFLMDVQMEPCMQTSRIRHALSSVQLFTERCLMNLETQVSPSSINAAHWQWMNRYRIWEANRKVFLFPENWIEPELRDDKSPFFKEIEGELLQGDITEDAASIAVLNYLSKLEDVAKLEPCSLFHVEGNPTDLTDDIDHVIARTAGASRKYYYRRFEFGYWTPWEQIKLDIEDDPVMPVVWKGRLLLFWLRILKQPQLDPGTLATSKNTITKMGEITMSALQSDAKSTAKTNAEVTVQAVLCWSEYYNGKWQPAKTSDVNAPTNLGNRPAAGPDAFNRPDTWLEANEEGAGKYLRITISGDVYSTFLLYNTHSRPVREEDVSHTLADMYIAPRSLDTHANKLDVTYYGTGAGFSGPVSKHSVLSNDLKDRTVETHHPLQNVNRAPFFYEDRRHVFFVSVDEEPVPVNRYPHYGIDLSPKVYEKVELPELVFAEDPRLSTSPKWWGDGGPIGPGDPGVVDPLPMKRFVTEDIYVTRGLATTGSVTYGGTRIGPAGRNAGPIGGR